MGVLRLSLAFIVFISHFANEEKFGTWISGPLAVRIFYLISGFYIQLIISKYDRQKHWKRNFYLSRLLRLFPTYYIMFILTAWLAGTTCNRYCTSMVINGTVSSLAFYYISNLLIIGQSLGKFLTYHYSNGLFSFDPHLSKPSYWVSNMQILSQSWSIAIELYFYFLAPFLLKRRSLDLIIIALISFAVKYILALYGYDNTNNWYNSFFPSEIHTFLLGALAARIAINEMKQYKKYLLPVGVTLLIGWITQKNPLFADPDELMIWSAFCFIPSLFILTQTSQIDRWLGELSYPVYLNHFLVIAFLKPYFSNPLQWLMASIILSILASAFIVIGIEHPITLFRHRKFRAVVFR